MAVPITHPAAGDHSSGDAPTAGTDPSCLGLCPPSAWISRCRPH